MATTLAEAQRFANPGRRSRGGHVGGHEKGRPRGPASLHRQAAVTDRRHNGTARRALLLIVGRGRRRRLGRGIAAFVASRTPHGTAQELGLLVLHGRRLEPLAASRLSVPAEAFGRRRLPLL